MASILESLSSTLADVQAKVARSLVQIRRAGKGIGAGTVWRSDGLVLTNAHVVQGRSRQDGWQPAAQLSVGLADGRDLPARVLAVDPRCDLAALLVDAEGLEPMALGDSQTLRPGHVVLAFGFPYGVQLGATLGAVVAPAGDLPESRNRSGEWLAASLHLRPGHSGGPMVDARGRLVGINTLMNGPDVGVAVPVHVARDFLRRVADAGRSRRAEEPTSAAAEVAWV